MKQIKLHIRIILKKQKDTEENQWMKIENDEVTEAFEYLQNRGNDVFLASKTGSILHISTNLIFESKIFLLNNFLLRLQQRNRLAL